MAVVAMLAMLAVCTQQPRGQQHQQQQQHLDQQTLVKVGLFTFVIYQDFYTQMNLSTGKKHDLSDSQLKMILVTCAQT